MSRSRVVAHDPSVADYRATSPYEWGGGFQWKSREAILMVGRSRWMRLRS
jgi:hypothetical protein